MADLEASLGLDLTDALSSVDDLASQAASALEDAFSGAGAGLTDSITSALAELSGVSADVAVNADVAAAESEVSQFVSATDADVATISVDADLSAAEEAVGGLGDSVQTAGAKTAEAGHSAEAFGAAAGLAAGETGELKGAIGGLGGAAGIAAGAGLALGGSFIHIANEALGAVGAQQRFTATVGEFADKVESIHVGNLTANLSELGLQFGSTDAQMKNTVSSLFQLATNSGFAGDEAAKFSGNVVALSARAVSLNPQLGTLSDVADSLGTRIARGGRFAAQYGIALTAAEINTRAMANTQKDAAGDLTITEKAFAATQLATEKYGDTLKGTVAEGADNVINKQKSLRAVLTETIETIGKPLVIPLLDLMREATPIIGDLALIFTELATAVLPTVHAALIIIEPPLHLIAEAMHSLPGPVLDVAGAVLVLNSALGLLALKEGEVAAAGGLAALGESAGGLAVSAPQAALGLGVLAVGYFGTMKAAEALGIGTVDLGEKLKDEDKLAHELAITTGELTTAAFKKMAGAARDAALTDTSPLLDKLRAFRDLAEENIDKAARFAASQDHNSTLYRGMIGVLEAVIAKRNEDQAASDEQEGAAGRLTKTVDITTESFKGAASEFGFFAAAAASSSGLTTDALDAITKHAADLDNATATAFSSATSIVSNFSSATEVSAEDIVAFLNNTVGAAQRWSINLRTLAREGIDEGIIEQLRTAGPKAEPLIEGLLNAVASGNLETINNAQESLRTLLANTNEDLDALALSAGIHAGNIAAVVDARLADLKEGGTKHLDELRATGDADLTALADKAEEQMGRVGAAVNGLPDFHQIDVAIIVRAQVVGAGLPDTAGVQAYIDSQANPYAFVTATVEYLKSLETRAAGGPVTAGQSYLVNEDTPYSEIFTPSVSGTITPNSQASAYGGAGSISIGQVVLQAPTNNPTREALDGAVALRRAAALVAL